MPASARCAKVLDPLIAGMTATNAQLLELPQAQGWRCNSVSHAGGHDRAAGAADGEHARVHVAALGSAGRVLTVADARALRDQWLLRDRQQLTLLDR